MTGLLHKDARGPLPALEAMIASGAIDRDGAQVEAARRLQRLYEALCHYKPHAGLIARLFGKTPAPPDGVYLHGDVGRGKSMLMDLFFETAPLSRKRRVHFHAFMQEIHDSIHEWRQMNARERKRRGFDHDDPLPPLAEKVAKDAPLLCFDEFQVEDVADAMILGRLFKGLFDNGVVIVLTSNDAPGDLYKHGLNRQLFLPFIDKLENRLDVVRLASPKDYRRDDAPGEQRYLVPHDDRAGDQLARAFERYTGGLAGERQTIERRRRNIVVPKAADGAAWFHFDDLCRRPLGAADYLAIAERYRTVLIEDIPRMDAAMRNEAKRFVTLIDTLYEAGTRLICSAAADPETLYPDGAGGVRFARTASRLYEMRSEDYEKAVQQAATT